IDRGATPCGQDAHDVLGLEVALPHYGCEIDQNTTPIEAGLERFVRFDKQYIGSEVLLKQREQGVECKLVGLEFSEGAVPLTGYRILDGSMEVGQITNSGYSPTLETSIAMGSVLAGYAIPGRELNMDTGERVVQVQVVPLPFYTKPRAAQVR
ncbi:MAG: glycine cleavage T C-terminal barrel domain-containing protein, partial [Dehalococcoidia bacterium]